MSEGRTTIWFMQFQQCHQLPSRDVSQFCHCDVADECSQPVLARQLEQVVLGGLLVDVVVFSCDFDVVLSSCCCLKLWPHPCYCNAFVCRINILPWSGWCREERQNQLPGRRTEWRKRQLFPHRELRLVLMKIGPTRYQKMLKTFIFSKSLEEWGMQTTNGSRQYKQLPRHSSRSHDPSILEHVVNIVSSSPSNSYPSIHSYVTSSSEVTFVTSPTSLVLSQVGKFRQETLEVGFPVAKIDKTC